jgi:hypothetical protein
LRASAAAGSTPFFSPLSSSAIYTLEGDATMDAAGLPTFQLLGGDNCSVKL